ncbi:hypothetical protein TGAMA5MH_04844 [Trichoderma gamsii]|uniref:Uncharacterized protein n=1 Tax=Trichoderma gamsii TaxID=398673 RepID=A0A2K0TD00_9HYPO|nr:hypothetical protein TGAMA5MH_04844 [Trichoderma gamsii]
MASDPFEAAQYSADIFGLYHENATIVRASVPLPQLPSGGCNYVDLTPGTQGSRCGCRRFWSSQPGSPHLDQAGWCMCNHHACYHDDHHRTSQPQLQSAEMISMPTTAQVTENLHAIPGLDAMSPVLDLMSTKETSVILGPELLSFNGASPLSFLQKPIDEHFNSLGAVPTPQQASASMPDTLAWTDPVRHTQPESPAGPASIPPQSLISQSTSNNSSIHAKYLRPFGGIGLHTLSSNNPSNVPLQSIEQPSLPESLLQQKTQSIEESFVFVTADEESTPRPDTATTQIEPRAVAAAAAAASSEALSTEALKNLTDIVGTHSERLDKLEASFSDNAHEECNDNYELMDIRVLELESKMEDIENRVLDNDSTNDHPDDATTPSEGTPTLSSATNRQKYSQEVYSQLQSLQAQVNQLQSVIPSWNHAWEVEVVFMPFPLGRLWQPISQFNAALKFDNEDDWTQLPMTLSTSRSRAQSPFLEDWAAHDREVEWLLPRACSNKGVADWRLRSRGLVKKIVVNNPDARSVSVAMHAAFGNVFRDMHMYARPQSPYSKASKYMGLQSPWVPLRKIHKDSRLRFLGPEEMLTPALWDVQFLNSIMMRSSEPRLFVTHPDAYLQTYEAYESSWTWTRLQEMPPAFDVTESQETPEMNRLEECWACNEQLDGPLAAQLPSKIPRQEERRVSISPSVEVFPTDRLWSEPTSTTIHRQSVIRRSKESVPPFPRTPSAPIHAKMHQSASGAIPKRQVSARGQSRRSSPAIQSLPQAGVTKRRQTRDLSGYARYTPRLTESPPSTPIVFTRQRSRSATPGRGITPARGTTPGDYATPHSIPPLREISMEPKIRRVREQSVAMVDADEAYEGSESSGFMSEDDESYNNEGGDAGEQEEEEENISTISAPRGSRLPVSSQFGPESSSPPRQLPRSSRDSVDEWPGVQDQGSGNHPNMENIAPPANGEPIDENHSDGENIDPNLMDVEHESDHSGPSEYPSTPRGWRDQTSGEIFIHQDDRDKKA